jgi:glutathione synthetase-like protein
MWRPRPSSLHLHEGEANLAQITEAVLQDGYAIVQELVDGGEDGDARIFLLEGQILERDGKLAAFRRVPTGNDPRANISAGGRSVPLEIGDVERGIVEAMSKKLVADGMYFVGIDVIGNEVVEINAESPGGMQSAERLYEIDVCPTVIEALERRRLEVLSHWAITELQPRPPLERPSRLDRPSPCLDLHPEAELVGIDESARMLAAASGDVAAPWCPR